MTGVYYCDTEEEFEEDITELHENPDFHYIGGFDMIQDIYDELEYQGFTEEEIETLSLNRYGDCLEILEYNSNYEAFIGAR